MAIHLTHQQISSTCKVRTTCDQIWMDFGDMFAMPLDKELHDHSKQELIDLIGRLSNSTVNQVKLAKRDAVEAHKAKLRNLLEQSI